MSKRESIGCVDFGNNNFYEVMFDNTSMELRMCYHGDGEDDEGETLSSLLNQVDPDHQLRILFCLSDCLKNLPQKVRVLIDY